MGAELLLSPHSSQPMYAQIIEQIVAKVMAGEWEEGRLLPSIRELAAASKVSVITVKRAYLELERAGVIVTRQGKGSFVAAALDATRALATAEFNAQLKGLLDAASKLGLGPRELVMRVEQALLSGQDTPRTSDDSNARKPE
ncbi:MAG: GntR family transcriptional regulator [Xanthomonadales bacterium]|nr:GntR family transcriptional regulator [Xanthomonadales bacterium]